MNYSKAIVQIDIDGVLADFNHGFTKLAQEMFGPDVPVRDTFAQQHWHQYEGLDKQQINAVWDEIGKRRWFWYLLKPLLKEETFKRIEGLERRGADIYFVTARHTGVMLRDQTELWLKVYGVASPTVVFTDDKAGFANAVGITHAIDDKLENGKALGMVLGPDAYLLDRPYNHQADEFERYTRIITVENFLTVVEEDLRGNRRHGRFAKDDEWGKQSEGWEAWGVSAA